MLKILYHFFFPHNTNNQRAKLLHIDTIFVVATLFLIATYFLSIVKTNQPDVLGLSIEISSRELLLLTNQERQKLGLNPLTYNQQLANAAEGKAQDMFNDNYWAHISPKTGKTPWVFISAAGYQYIYAGENLARGFTNTADVMKAWLASPSHRANVLSPNYQEVGFAIKEGPLTGENDTVLVVEMFGGKTNVLSQVKSAGVPINTAFAETPKAQVSYPSISKVAFIDRFWFAKNLTQFLLMIFIAIFILDIILIEKKKITRLVGHNLDHIIFLTGILLLIIRMSIGTIF